MEKGTVATSLYLRFAFHGFSYLIVAPKQKYSDNASSNVPEKLQSASFKIKVKNFQLNKEKIIN
jgi:hypothetical protein